MRIKKLLALLMSAALALTLLAGCGGDQLSLRQLLLDLLRGQYGNVTITAGPAMSDILRNAVSQGDSQEEIDNALQDALQPTVSFDSLWNATSQDNAFDLAYYPGGDAETIARQVYTDWNKALNTLPSGSRYVADLAAIQADNGYYVLLSVAGGDSHSVTNSDAGSSNDGSGNGITILYPDPEEDDTSGTDAPDQDPGSGYWTDGKDLYVIYTDTALNNLLFGSDDAFEEDRDNGFLGKTIKLKPGEYEISQQFKSFQGTLTSYDPEKRATIQLSGGKSLFEEVDTEVSHLNFEVTETITYDNLSLKTSRGGVVAGENTGTILDCHVTFDDDAGMLLTCTGSAAYIGGIAGYNLGGTIEECSVSGGFITINSSVQNQLYVGGITGHNQSNGTVKNCTVSGSTITVDLENLIWGGTIVGGIVGYNQATVEEPLNVSGNSITVTYKDDATGKEYQFTQEPGHNSGLDLEEPIPIMVNEKIGMG